MPTTSGPRRRRKEHLGALTEARRLFLDRRLALGLTQSALADLAGVGISSVRALEAGQVTVTLGVTLQVLEALGLAAAVGPRPALRAVPEAVVLAPAVGSR
jgi:transcriptional regulator with XRE-family HTH domain